MIEIYYKEKRQSMERIQKLKPICRKIEKNSLLSQFGKYRRIIRGITKLETAKRQSLKMLAKLAEKQRITLVNNYIKQWRRQIGIQLNLEIEKQKEITAQQSEIQEQQDFACKIFKLASLLLDQKCTEDELISSIDFIELIKEIQAYMCNKFTADECVLSMKTISNKSQMKLFLGNKAPTSSVPTTPIGPKGTTSNSILSDPLLIEDDPIVQAMMEKSKAFMSQNIQNETQFYPALKKRKLKGIKSALACPLFETIPNSLLGTIEIYRKSKAFTSVLILINIIIRTMNCISQILQPKLFKKFSLF